MHGHFVQDAFVQDVLKLPGLLRRESQNQRHATHNSAGKRPLFFASFCLGWPRECIPQEPAAHAERGHERKPLGRKVRGLIAVLGQGV